MTTDTTRARDGRLLVPSRRKLDPAVVEGLVVLEARQIRRDWLFWFEPPEAAQLPFERAQVAPAMGGLAGWVPILTWNRPSSMPAV